MQISSSSLQVQFNQSKAWKMSHVRDLSPVSGSIIWAKQVCKPPDLLIYHLFGQIDRQLTAYMHRVEDVLSKVWTNHVEGLKLQPDGDSFRIIGGNQYKLKVGLLSSSTRPFLFFVLIGHNEIPDIQVDFLPEIIQLSKEIRNQNLVFVNKANQLYVGISLIGSVRTYKRSLEKMEARRIITLLTAGLRKDDIDFKVQVVLDDLMLVLRHN